MNTKPKLVDYNLLKKPNTPVLKRKVILPTKNDNSFFINIIGLLILIIGGLCIYHRYIEKNNKEIENKNLLLNFHQYVKENIK